MSPWITVPLVLLIVVLTFGQFYLMDRRRGKGYRWRNPKYVVLMIAVVVVGLGLGVLWGMFEHHAKT